MVGRTDNFAAAATAAECVNQPLTRLLPTVNPLGCEAQGIWDAIAQ